MRFPSKSPGSDEFERGRRIGRKEERGLIAQELHKTCSDLTAALLAIESSKEPGAQQAELVSRAFKLLTVAIEDLGDVLKGQRDEHLRKCTPPKNKSQATRAKEKKPLSLGEGLKN
jgi:hypothetical protein